MGRRAVAEAGVPWTEIRAVGIGCGGPLDAERGVLVLRCTYRAGARFP